MIRILDCYLSWPLLCDLIIVLLLCVLLHFTPDIFPIHNSDITTLQGSLASTAVSLAGFIIAALTIIVTFKANIESKKVDQSVDGMDLLFNSNNYTRIVKVFQFAIIELVFCFAMMHTAMFFSDNFSPRHNLLLALSTLSFLLLALLRCLYVLFSVLDVESQPKH